ncbi:MAG: hypothetical protein GC206_04580 [Alphaproteobacteria bacterium]|nr:hypothetical protein [Alphaproteobacteria bacterium]
MIAMTVALGACGVGEQEKAKAEDEKAAAQSARDRILAMDPTAAADFLVDQVRNGPGGPRACDFVYEFADLGDVPAGEAAGVHRAHVGARAFTLQCGAPGASGARRYVVYLPRARGDAVIAPCAEAACASGFLAAGDAAPAIPPEDFEK